MGNNDGGAASMTFTVFSPSVSVNRDLWGHSKHSDKIVQSPGPVCSPLAGIQTFATSGYLNGYFTGNFHIWCTWVNPKNGARFGIQIQVPFQEFGFGSDPYWQVMYDKSPGSGDIDWVGVASSEPYTWPDDIIGLHVVATPTSDHNYISIAVIIDPPIKD